MTIDEAIISLEECQREQHPYTPRRWNEAKQLSIEALKWISENRVGMAGHVVKLLPGETPEINSHRSLHHIKKTLEGKKVSK